jgi:hypothetical protein
LITLHGGVQVLHQQVDVVHVFQHVALPPWVTT